MLPPGAKTRAQRAAELLYPKGEQWMHDPVGWARERGRLELWSKQEEILRSVAANSQTAVHSCHEVGKSFIAATTVCWWLDTHLPGEARVVTTAPTAPQVKAILWHEINRLHRSAGLPGRTNMTEWYIGNEMVAFGRKPSDHNNSAFQGIHARYFLVVLDEACGIPLQLWNAASTLAANEHSRVLAIGNPDDPSGEFAANCRPDSGWNIIKIGYRDTPNFTGEPVSQKLKDLLIHESWVEARRKKWGQESALFQAKCEGEFPTVGDPFQVIAHAWATKCRWLDLPTPAAGVERDAGLDVGAGNDRTVVTVRAGDKVLAQKTFISPDPEKSTGEVALFLREWKVRRVKVDSIGVGWGIYGALRTSSRYHHPHDPLATHDAQVIPINVAESPSPSQQHLYWNRRAELWFLGRELSKEGRWDLSALEDDVLDDLISELTTPRYEIVDSKGKVKIESKDKIRKRTGVSPDLAESLLLSFAPATWEAKSAPDQLLQGPSLLTALPARESWGGPVGLGERGW